MRREYNIDGIKPEILVEQMNYGCFYWYGYDRIGHPIVWVRPKLLDYKRINVPMELKMHMLFLEMGIKLMMQGKITSFTLVADAKDLGVKDFDYSLMAGLVELVTTVYPDRLEGFWVGPVNSCCKIMLKLLTPLLPERIRNKIHLIKDVQVELLACIDASDIPDFMNGPSKHPSFRDEHNNFSFHKMINSMEEQAKQRASAL